MFNSQLNGYGYKSNFEQGNTTPTPALLGRETASYGETLCVNIDLRIGSAPNKVDKISGRPTSDAKFFKVQPMTGIFIPKAYVPQNKVHIVLYLHGHKGRAPGNEAAINHYWNGHQFPFFALREEVNRSGQNVIFVAPTLGPLSQAGNLITAKGFDGYLAGVLAALNEHFVRNNSWQEVREIGKITLAAHSGGGSPMLRIVELKSSLNTSKIVECWGFDSVYGNVEKRWVNWAAAHPEAALFIYYYDTASRSETVKTIGKKRKLQNVCVHGWTSKDWIDWSKLQPPLPKSRVGPHFWIPIVYLKERLQNSLCRAEQGRQTRAFQYRPPRHHAELELPTSTGIDWRTVRDKAVILAVQEYKRWDKGQRHETNPKFAPLLEKYWVDGAGLSPKAARRAIANRSAWSAAFISWLMRAVGAGNLFRYSAGHYVYVSAAKKNRLRKRTKNPFWTYRISEARPEVGDLVCNARCSRAQPERCGATFDNVDNGNSWSLHCDIVVDVRPDHILTIGGNTGDQFGGLKGDTIGMKKICLDNSRKIRKGQRTNYIAVIKFRTNGE